MKIKNYIFVVLVVVLIGIPSLAQRRRPEGVRVGRPAKVLTAAETTSVLDTTLESCGKTEPVVPQANAPAFPMDSIEKTLNGVWRGRIKGTFDSQFVAKDGFVNADYYLIVDVKRREALVMEQLSDIRSVPEPKPGAPVWTYVFCGKENYVPRHPPQVHEFHKVSDNVQDARAALSTSTGLTFAATSEVVLSDIWQKLVETKYFESGRSPSYAGGFFKPFDIGNIPSIEGGHFFFMKLDAEYRAGGLTPARFEPGVPIRGIEQGQFVGVTTGSGDFLVSSFKNGAAMAKEATEGGLMSMFFDKVVIGPLTPSSTASLRKAKK